MRPLAFLIAILATSPAFAGGAATFYADGSNSMVAENATLQSYAGGGGSDDARQYEVVDYPTAVQTCRVFYGELPKEYLGETPRVKTPILSRSSETGTEALMRATLHCSAIGSDFHTLTITGAAGHALFAPGGQYLTKMIDHGVVSNNCAGRVGPIAATLRICRLGEDGSDDHTGTVSVPFSKVYW